MAHAYRAVFVAKIDNLRILVSAPPRLGRENLVDFFLWDESGRRWFRRGGLGGRGSLGECDHRAQNRRDN